MRILYLDCFFGFDASMLLGALIDAGADPGAMEGMDIRYSKTLRSSLECTRAYVASCDMEETAYSHIFESAEPSQGTTPSAIKAVISAAEQLSIEYIMCSDIGICDGTDGEVLAVLEGAGIEALPSDGENVSVFPADARFLAAIVNETGPKPAMDILAIGYGAGGTDIGSTHLLTAFIGEYNPEELFDRAEYEEIASYL